MLTFSVYPKPLIVRLFEPDLDVHVAVVVPWNLAISFLGQRALAREPFNILFLFMFIICLQHSSMQYTHHVHAQYCGLKFDPRHGCSRSCFLL